MRVALVQELGGIDRVELGERPDPAPAAGRVLVRVHGAGVGPWDVGFLSGGFPGLALPFIPGQEVAGIVEAVGDEAGVQPGERVYASLFPAGGGFLGASEVFDYHAADWVQQVRAAVPGGVDLLLDGAGGRTRDQAIGAIRDGGRAIFIVLQGPPAQLERGITGESFAAHVNRQRLEALRRLVKAGTLRPQVSECAPCPSRMPITERESAAQGGSAERHGAVPNRSGRRPGRSGG